MKLTVGIIGLGYVGLPLAIALSRKHKIVGYDINKKRVEELKKANDESNQISSTDIKKAQIHFHYLAQNLKECSVYIITVPTPLKDKTTPDFSFLKKASRSVSRILKKGDLVVYESTVFPGATEEICVPILETSGLLFNHDFFVGYSPERINIGDSQNNIDNIPKIVSASNSLALKRLTDLYKSALGAKIYAVSSIRVAEAAKVIENSQRDVNIAFVNEMAIVLNNMGIDTREVLKAASTKWNFLDFNPGLVGGHCIGIDPYYLSHKSEELGYKPKLLLSARKINEHIPYFVCKKIIEKLNEHKIKTVGSKVLLLGAAFKENTSDIRNSKAITIANNLLNHHVKLTVCDPLIDSEEIPGNLQIRNKIPENEKFDVIIMAVKHKEFYSLSPLDLLTHNGFVYDIKHIFKNHPRIYRF